MKTQNRPLLKEKITSHLQQMIDRGSSAIARQFKCESLIGTAQFVDNDPLGEETKYSPVKGIVHKFSNRILWKVSYRCAAHCQFCTRIRQIGSSEGDLSDRDIKIALQYIGFHKEVDDVILSGGDPFTTPRVTLIIISGLLQIESVKMIRIGTRLPVHCPASLKSEPVKRLLGKISEITRYRPLIVLIHINHPDELMVQTVEAINSIRTAGATVMTQSVFLSGINDSVEVMARLFTLIYHLGVIPYYLYHCDSVRGLERFIVPLKREQQIVTELRRRLSGIALPTHVVDVTGKGKIDVPLDFWEGVDLAACSDYEGKHITLINL